jgi:hypothetical protein
MFAPGHPVSIKRPVLLNVLVWIFLQKSLLNDLIYLKFKSRTSLLIKQPLLSQFQILEALNDQVL